MNNSRFQFAENSRFFQCENLISYFSYLYTIIYLSLFLSKYRVQFFLYFFLSSKGFWTNFCTHQHK